MMIYIPYKNNNSNFAALLISTERPTKLPSLPNLDFLVVQAGQFLLVFLCKSIWLQTLYGIEIIWSNFEQNLNNFFWLDRTQYSTQMKFSNHKSRQHKMNQQQISDNGGSGDAFLLSLTYCTASGGILWQSRILTNCMAQKAQSEPDHFPVKLS